MFDTWHSHNKATNLELTFRRHSSMFYHHSIAHRYTVLYILCCHTDIIVILYHYSMMHKVYISLKAHRYVLSVFEHVLVLGPVITESQSGDTFHCRALISNEKACFILICYVVK